ncbi:MAG: hypothetical protein J2P17_16960 [Mycobacterium sp.]|nr:hypothetical protein [Mycobacterium sp.]
MSLATWNFSPHDGSAWTPAPAVSAPCDALNMIEPMPAHGVRDLRQKVIRHVEELASEALDNDALDLGMAARIADALLSLISASADFDDRGKAAVRGAVDYFVLNRDEEPDLDARGFIDDARIVNETCDVVGLPELKVRIS